MFVLLNHALSDLFDLKSILVFNYRGPKLCCWLFL